MLSAVTEAFLQPVKIESLVKLKQKLASVLI